MEAIKCPKCQITMREREQGDVIVDICPQCRGVWLDAGELEKLSVRESRYYDDDDDDDDYRRQPAYREDDRARYGDRPPYDDRPRYDERGRDPRGGQYYGKPKKKGFLSSMMESFGGEGAGDD
jgi:Zn-finger nucleic acid-binding protein